MSRSSEHPRIQPPPRWNHRLHEASHEDDTAKGGRTKRQSRKSLVEDPAGFNLRMHELAHESDEMAGNLFSSGGMLVRPPSLLISPASPESIMTQLNFLGPGSTAFPSANRAYYTPFYLTDTITVVKLWCMNGDAVSGNVDIGIYDGLGVLKVSSGSTAQTGTAVLQAFDVTDTTLEEGHYFIGAAMDNTTGAFFRWIPNIEEINEHRARMQAAAFPLPNTATFAAVSGAGYVPLAGLSQRDVFV